MNSASQMILVVDDEEIVRKLLADYLVALGHRVTARKTVNPHWQHWVRAATTQLLWTSTCRESTDMS